MSRTQKSDCNNGGQSALHHAANQAVIYCRVSTKDQVDNFSLTTQEKACRDYCHNYGFSVNKVFIEEGESAKTVNRPQFKKMLAYCRENKNKVKCLVVYAVSRFARSSHDHMQTRVLLSGLGVSLRSVTEHFDDTSQGKLMESILASFAQFDNDVRAERTVAGMKAAIQSGKWTFKAPIGYLNGDKTTGSRRLIPDPARGPLVKMAFELYGTGLHTKQQVLEKVNASGLRTIKGKRLSAQTFEQILKKPVYAGWLVVADWGERQRGDFEPLVSQEVFDRVQSVLSGKRVSVMPRLRSHPDFPLRHFVKCGCCGRPLTASWTKGRSKLYANYRCQNKPCKSVSITKAALESAFVNFLEGLQPKPQYLKLFNEVVLDVWKEKQAQNHLLNASLQQHISILKDRKERLEETFIYEKTIDRETYLRRLDKLNEEITVAEMNERDAKLEGFDVESVLNFAEHVILNAARLWMEASTDQKQRLQKLIFPQGVNFANWNYGTAEICPFFNMIAKNEGEKTSLATLPGIEPGLPP
jgi:site-specific DNA recombinase